MLRTILPTILITLVTFSTNFYVKNHYDAAVTVNLTSLLVMVTLYISISDGLPSTSYMKMIDVWLIFSLFMPFTEVTLHAFLKYFSYKMEENEETWPQVKVAPKLQPKVAFQRTQSQHAYFYQNATKWTKIVLAFLPILFALFMVVFFGYGILRMTTDPTS